MLRESISLHLNVYYYRVDIVYNHLNIMEQIITRVVSYPFWSQIMSMLRCVITYYVIIQSRTTTHKRIIHMSRRMPSIKKASKLEQLRGRVATPKTRPNQVSTFPASLLYLQPCTGFKSISNVAEKPCLLFMLTQARLLFQKCIV